jgi:hypothetical protein
MRIGNDDVSLLREKGLIEFKGSHCALSISLNRISGYHFDQLSRAILDGIDDPFQPHFLGYPFNLLFDWIFYLSQDLPAFQLSAEPVGPPGRLFTADSGLDNISSSAESGYTMGDDLTDANNEIDFFDQSIDENRGPTRCLS